MQINNFKLSFNGYCTHHQRLLYARKIIFHIDSWLNHQNKDRKDFENLKELEINIYDNNGRKNSHIVQSTKVWVYEGQADECVRLFMEGAQKETPFRPRQHYYDYKEDDNGHGYCFYIVMAMILLPIGFGVGYLHSCNDDYHEELRSHDFASSMNHAPITATPLEGSSTVEGGEKIEKWDNCGGDGVKCRNKFFRMMKTKYSAPQYDDHNPATTTWKLDKDTLWFYSWQFKDSYNRDLMLEDMKQIFIDCKFARVNFMQWDGGGAPYWTVYDVKREAKKEAESRKPHNYYELIEQYDKLNKKK